MGFLLWLAQFWFVFLSWLDRWNGTYLRPDKGYLEINYRYRFKSYTIHVPYSLTQGPQEFLLKGHSYPVPYQNGIKLLIDPVVLGYDGVQDYFAAD